MARWGERIRRKAAVRRLKQTVAVEGGGKEEAQGKSKRERAMQKEKAKGDKQSDSAKTS